MFRLTNVTWERIYADLTVAALEEKLMREDLHFYLLNSSGGITLEFAVREWTADTICLRMNVTNSGINRCIGNGNFRILVTQGKQVLGPVLCYEKSEVFAHWNNHFLYRSSSGCYTVTFMVDEFTELPELCILVYDMKKPSGSEAYGSLLKRIPKSLKRRTKNLLKKRARWMMRQYYEQQRKNSTGKNILFYSEMDSKLALNMQTIYDRMVERGLDKEYSVNFFLRRIAGNPLTNDEKLQRFRLVSDADIILVDDYAGFFDSFSLSPEVRLIQIWHAGAGFKGVGYSRWGHFGCPGPVCVHRRYDYCIAGSASIAHFFSEQFGILEEQIIPTGMPRVDLFLDDNHRREATQALYRDYPQLQGKEVILFAPTYRGQGRKTAYYPYELIDFDALYRYCCERDAVILFKMHPWVSQPVPIEEQYADRFLDLNSFPNINDLFYVTDLLITDYSSSMYEFILMKKPMLLFAYDKNQFATSRGFHRDYDSNVPGKICESFEDLMTAMWERDYEFEKVDEFLSYYFDQVDCGSTDRVIDWLILDKLPQQYRDALAQKRASIAATRSLHLLRPEKNTWENAVLAEAEEYDELKAAMEEDADAKAETVQVG